MTPSIDLADRKPVFTVLTPTYNRAPLLPAVFASLERQTFRDFEWLVVDDGSTDETRDVVARLAETAQFPVRYQWQSNGHKKKAMKTGFAMAQAPYTIVLDSDDELLPEALQIFHDAWSSIAEAARDRFGSVRALCVDEKGKIVGDSFVKPVLDTSYSELVYRYGTAGEKLSCDRTDLLRSLEIPDQVRGYVPEHVLWTQLSGPYLTRAINRPVRVYKETAGSISQGLIHAQTRPDADGLAYAYAFALDADRRWFWKRPAILVKAAANLTRFNRHLHASEVKRAHLPETAWGRVVLFLFGWLGLLLYWRDRRYSRSG
jgi:glycosyltransferase involved in cell wall biosynthesis